MVGYLAGHAICAGYIDSIDSKINDWPLIENTLYHIHLGDWVSWFLSEMNNVDAIEIDVINFLKGELAKI